MKLPQELFYIRECTDSPVVRTLWYSRASSCYVLGHPPIGYKWARLCPHTGAQAFTSAEKARNAIKAWHLDREGLTSDEKVPTFEIVCARYTVAEHVVDAV